MATRAFSPVLARRASAFVCERNTISPRRAASGLATQPTWQPRDENYSPRRFNPPILDHQELYRREGIPGVVTWKGFEIGWTDYQDHMCDCLHEMTEGTVLEHSSPEKILIQTAREPDQAALFNHASMSWNNNFFYNTMTPNPVDPSPDLLREIKTSFSSFAILRDTLLATASAMFGPGHVWLVRTRSREGNNLRILTTYIAGSPLSRAHWRRQPRDLNTASPDEPADALHGVAAGVAPERMTEVQNSVGVAGRYSKLARPASAAAYQGGGEAGQRPFGGVEVAPLLCVSTWPHVYMYDYGVRRRTEYLERWWEAVDWGKVEAGIRNDRPLQRGAFIR